MCTRTNKEPQLQTAKEDIIVYKRVNIRKNRLPQWLCKLLNKEKYRITSLHQGFEYKLGRIYNTKLGLFRKVTENCYASTTGFYSWGEDIFSYTGRVGYCIPNVKCVIPKGAQYFLCRDVDSGIKTYHSNDIAIISVFEIN